MVGYISIGFLAAVFSLTAVAALVMTFLFLSQGNTWMTLVMALCIPVSICLFIFCYREMRQMEREGKSCFR